MAKNVSKGNAIKALCKRLQISLEVIVFGDSLNDKSMFEVAGYSVAMEMLVMNSRKLLTK